MQRILPRGGCARRGGVVVFASDDETSKRKNVFIEIYFFYFNYSERKIFTSVEFVHLVFSLCI